MNDPEDLAALILTVIGHNEPVAALRVVARGLIAEGIAREQVVAGFEGARSILQQEGRECEEEHLLDVLDAMHGWVAPGNEI